MTHFETIQEFCHMLGVEPQHPLVSVVNFSDARPIPHMRHTNGFYAVMLKDEKFCNIAYGRSRYDYDRGTVVCTAPGQVVGIEDAGEFFQPVGWGLFFAPELLYGTMLRRTMKEYTFFSYSANEALHLSERERKLFLRCLGEIRAELDRGIDRLTRHLVASDINLLLDHCLYFYNRQFVTREPANADILARFEQLLNGYFEGNNARLNGLPTVEYCASQLCLSANYFGDLIKQETGKSPREHIKLHTLNAIKEQLAGSEKSITQISYELGFLYSQHLSRFFKQETGMTPGEFRRQIL